MTTKVNKHNALTTLLSYIIFLFTVAILLNDVLYLILVLS